MQKKQTDIVCEKLKSSTESKRIEVKLTEKEQREEDNGEGRSVRNDELKVKIAALNLKEMHDDWISSNLRIYLNQKDIDFIEISEMHLMKVEEIDITADVVMVQDIFSQTEFFVVMNNRRLYNDTKYHGRVFGVGRKTDSDGKPMENQFEEIENYKDLNFNWIRLRNWGETFILMIICVEPYRECSGEYFLKLLNMLEMDVNLYKKTKNCYHLGGLEMKIWRYSL